jgi:diguanylate cyclase (GGDEF)-like protein
LPVLTLLLAFAASNARADGDWDRLGTPQILHIGRKDGLPQGTINTITRDAEGFVWIGSEGGLARWDGYELRVFRHEDGDPTSLPDSLIVALRSTESGPLWISTAQESMTRFDRATETFRSFPLAAARIGNKVAVATDDRGGIWVDGEQGLAELDPATGTWRHETATGIGLPSRSNRTLLQGRGGVLWLARGGAIGRLVDGHFTRVDLPTPNADAADPAWAVTRIFEAEDGSVWYGTKGGQVGRLDPTNLEAKLVPEVALPGTEVWAITQLPDGTLAFGYAGAGITVYRPGSPNVIHLTAATGLADDDVRSVVADPSGLLFIGSSRGVDVYAPGMRAVTSITPGFPPKAPLSDGIVTRVLERPDGTLWFGHENGPIDVFDRHVGRIATIDSAPAERGGEERERFLAMAPLADGGVLTSSNLGISRIEPETRVMRRLKGAVRGGDAILETAAGVWVATLEDGVERIDDQGHTLARFRHDPADPDSLTSNTATALAAESGGRIWVGTAHGLDLLDPATGRARHFTRDDRDQTSSPASDVWALLKDHRGRLWVGSGGNGIGVLDAIPAEGPARFHRIGRAQGMPHDNVDTLIEDAKGRIWAATDDGLAVIDPDSLTVSRTLKSSDGQVITNYFEGSGTQLADGTLLFGGDGGVSVVEPERLTAWTYRPPVRVTEVKVGGRNQPAAAPIVLNPEARRIEVEFAALDYSAPDENHYAYRLEGYDQDWRPASAMRRMAVYENLPPGVYRLLLRGSNRAGIWSDPLALPILVQPAWFETGWFRTAEIMAGIGLILATIQFRTRALNRRRRQLEQEVAARTRELAVSAETLMRANAQLERLADQDPLTGLGNRRHFFRKAEELLALARRHERPCSLLMVDLDYFKRINDVYGHGGGDAALCAAGRCLEATLREIDVIARFGGEELAAFLPETDLVGGCAVAERFRAALEALHVEHEGATIRVTASIGVASWHRSESGIQPALDRADAALYRAKQSGRNRVASE